MMNYTNNGIANLASYGRGNDTELVHMTPGEVKGLQALALAHGGSLTINPSTGLPEAGFLEDILPVVAAAGLTYLTAGAAAPMLAGTLGATGAGIVAGAGAGALISGGMAAVQGKDVGQAALMGAVGGGFSGGMGAYGDANVFGVGAAPTDAVTQATQASLEAASTLNPQAGGFQQVASDQLIPTEQGNLLLPGGSAQSSVNIGSNIPEQFAQGTPSTFAPTSSSTPPSYYSKLKPENYIQKAAILGLPALGVLQADQNMPGEQDDEYTRRLKGYKLSPNYKAYEAPRPNPYYRPTYAAEGGVMNSFDDSSGMDEPAGLAQGNLQKGLFGLGYADGGIARYRNKGEVNVLQDYLDRQDKEERQIRPLSTNPSSYFPDVGIFRDPDVDTARKDALTAAMIRLGKAGKGAGIKTTPLPKTSIRGLGDIRGATPEIEEAAKGGVMSHLGGYSDGGRMLKGPGDGMSDSIPASIAGKQPARLADGEFVVPADVVSHLGNGSTDAGAKKLYSMMDKIRQARTGKKKQAPQVNVDKYLPMGKASGGITGYAEGGEVERFQNQGVVTDADKIKASVQKAYEAGYSGSQIGAALRQTGVSQKQASDATGLSLSEISQMYAGGENIGTIGEPAGNPAYKIVDGKPVPNTPTPVTPVTSVTPTPATTPTVKPYTDQEVLNAINTSLKQGVGLEDTKNALRTRYGITDAQLYAVADLYKQPTTTPTPTVKSYSDQEVLDAIKASVKQGVGLEDTKNALRTRYGITDAQLYAVADLYTKPTTPTQTPVTPKQTYTPQQYLNLLTGLTGSGKTLEAAKLELRNSYGATDADLYAMANLYNTQQTPEQKFNEAASKSIAAYRPSFVPRVSGISMSPTMQDPYSNIGLQSLYEQMMGQYKAPTQPRSDADIRTFAQDFANRNPGKGAELGQALINQGIPVNQAIAATGLSPGTLNTAYIGGQRLGTAAPPTLNTQYNYSDPGTYYRPAPVNNLVLQNPITDAVTAEANQAKADTAAAAVAATANANSATDGGTRAGGLMSIDRKKRAKYKK